MRDRRNPYVKAMGDVCYFFCMSQQIRVEEGEELLMEEGEFHCQGQKKTVNQADHP